MSRRPLHVISLIQEDIEGSIPHLIWRRMHEASQSRDNPWAVPIRILGVATQGKGRSSQILDTQSSLQVKR